MKYTLKKMPLVQLLTCGSNYFHLQSHAYVERFSLVEYDPLCYGEIIEYSSGTKQLEGSFNKYRVVRSQSTDVCYCCQSEKIIMSYTGLILGRFVQGEAKKASYRIMGGILSSTGGTWSTERTVPPPTAAHSTPNSVSEGWGTFRSSRGGGENFQNPKSRSVICLCKEDIRIPLIIYAAYCIY